MIFIVFNDEALLIIVRQNEFPLEPLQDFGFRPACDARVFLVLFFLATLFKREDEGACDRRVVISLQPESLRVQTPELLVVVLQIVDGVLVYGVE